MENKYSLELTKISIHIPVYNEELMLPFTISFYRSRFPNCEIIIYDDNSTDNTVSIAKENNCTVDSYITDNKIDDVKLKNFKNTCWKNSETDWNIVCDCDELLDITEDELNKEDALGVSIIFTEGYDMVNLDENLDIPNIKYGYRNTMYDKRVLFKKSLIPEINYGIGAHTVKPLGIIKRSTCVYKLRHYKFINLDYMIKRYSEYKSRLCEVNVKNQWGVQYLYSQQQIKNIYGKTKLKANIRVCENF